MKLIVALVAMAFWVLTLPTFASEDIDPKTLTSEIQKHRYSISEFKEIESQAKALSLRVWLTDSSASAFAQYVRWNFLREHGHKEYQAEWFDHDLMTIFGYRRELHLAVDGPTEKVQEFRSWIETAFPYQSKFGNRWRVHKGVGLIELTASSDPVISDPEYLKELSKGILRHRPSPQDEPIVSAVRYLIEVFQSDLKITAEDQSRLHRISTEFKPEEVSPKTRRWLETYGPELIQDAMSFGETWHRNMKSLSFAEKIARASEDLSSNYKDQTYTPEPRAERGSLRWWMLKDPLTHNDKVLSMQSFSLPYKPGQLESIVHTTNSLDAYDSITRSPKGIPNLFASRKGHLGLHEEASHGTGMYARENWNDFGELRSGNHIFHVILKVSPAISGSDYRKAPASHAGDLIFTSIRGLRVARENFGDTPEEIVEYLKMPRTHQDSGKILLARRKLERFLYHPKFKKSVASLICQANLLYP